jgi:signal transduction histidine kinase
MTQRRLAILCDQSGKVMEVLCDDVHVTGLSVEGAVFPALATDSSMKVCFDMIQALRSEHAVYGWMVELQSDAGPISLHFAGVLRDEQLLLIASEEKGDVPGFSDELMQVTNEHASKLRLLMKNHVAAAASSVGYEEMMGLQNEISTLHRQLAAKSQRLKELSEERNLLLGMAAHDMRGPLWSVRQIAKQIMSDEAVPAEHQDVLGQIADACEYMNSIADCFLNFSSIESGKLALERQPASLAELAGRAVRMNAGAAALTEVAVFVDAQQDDPALVDADRIVQVIGNLITNAVAHSPTGSTVLCSVWRDGPEMCLSVADDGPGIPLDQRDEVFEVFQSGDTKPASQGLGLAIADRLVKLHGGRIAVDCPSAGGTIFEIRLPAVSLESQPSA